jgi:phosphate transport system substrate-binding protein
MRWSTPQALVLLPLLLWSALAGVATGQTSIREAGSTLLHPLMDLWAEAYMSAHPDVRIETHVPGQGSGSAVGIASSIAGEVEIGGSDAPLHDNSSTQPRMLSIPIAVSAQQVDFNVPEFHDASLRLSGPVLAAIYDGTLTVWDDPRIAGLNPTLHLPHHRIVPIRRADNSVDTYLFTEYLASTTPSWERTVHYGLRVTWPAIDVALAERGNAGVVELCKEVPYSLAYVGVSLLGPTQAGGLGIASLQDRDGEFVQPTPKTIALAADTRAAAVATDDDLSIVYVGGRNAYPIVNLEYAIVRLRQPDSGVASAVRGFLDWAIDPKGGNTESFLGPVHFVALPAKVLALSRSEIASITGP